MRSSIVEIHIIYALWKEPRQYIKFDFNVLLASSPLVQLSRTHDSCKAWLSKNIDITRLIAWGPTFLS